MDFSPFWLGLSSLLRKIAITNRTIDTAQARSDSTALTSGTPGMRHITLKDEVNNFFVFKKTKEPTDTQSVAESELSSDQSFEMHDVRHERRRSSGKITS